VALPMLSPQDSSLSGLHRAGDGARHMLCLRSEATLLLCPWMLGNQCSPVIEADELGSGFDIDMAADQRMSTEYACLLYNP
jgi:hypothetical protein